MNSGVAGSGWRSLAAAGAFVAMAAMPLQVTGSDQS
jgi:hypothetical protein